MIDLEYINQNSFLIGTDEVGRGPLAGPVVSCATSINDSIDETLYELEDLCPHLTDSKQLTHNERADILKYLKIDVKKLTLNRIRSIKFSNKVIRFSLASVGPQEIDEINILQASLKSMREAVKKHVIPKRQGLVLIDGNKFIHLNKKNVQEVPIIKGDSKSYLIGLASIIAKEYRDNLMEDFGEEFPGYGLENHSGYPTPTHRRAIAELGVTPIHRRSFKGVKEHVTQI